MLVIALGVIVGLFGFQALSWLVGTREGHVLIGAGLQLALAALVIVVALALAYS